MKKQKKSSSKPKWKPKPTNPDPIVIIDPADPFWKEVEEKLPLDVLMKLFPDEEETTPEKTTSTSVKKKKKT